MHRYSNTYFSRESLSYQITLLFSDQYHSERSDENDLFTQRKWKRRGKTEASLNELAV